MKKTCFLILALLFCAEFEASAVESKTSPAKQNSKILAATQTEQGALLSVSIIKQAAQISAVINKSGGYRMDGKNDCYGFLRRVWDPVLRKMGDKPLPVSDMVSRNWAPITSWSKLRPGDVLSTHQGHKWGGDWHGGFFAGIRNKQVYIFDNSPYNKGGAYIRINPPGTFHYYYIPTHKLLLGESE